MYEEIKQEPVDPQECNDMEEEVFQEEVSYPQPNHEETHKPLQELIHELTDVVPGNGFPPPHLSFGERCVPKRMALHKMPHVPMFAVLQRGESGTLYEGCQ